MIMILFVVEVPALTFDTELCLYVLQADGELMNGEITIKEVVRLLFFLYLYVNLNKLHQADGVLILLLFPTLFCKLCLSALPCTFFLF